MSFRAPAQSVDISFKSKAGINVVLTLSVFSDRFVITISELQKIGHVIDIYFPKTYYSFSNIAYHRAEFESKVIFGPNTVS